MRNNGSEPKVSLPPEVADWMGAAEDTALATAHVGVPGQRGWRERLKDLMEG